MDRGQKLLALFLSAAVFAAAIAGWLLVESSSHDLALKRLFLDVGLWFTLMFLVAGVKVHQPARIKELVEALRALTRGRHDSRLEHELFPKGLDEVARAFNEVAATLGEHDDPNLGPVVSQPRGSRPPTSANQSTKPAPAMPIGNERRGTKESLSDSEKSSRNSHSSTPANENTSDHPELGEVRVMNQSQIKRAKDSVKKDAALKRAYYRSGKPAVKTQDSDAAQESAPSGENQSANAVKKSYQKTSNMQNPPASAATSKTKAKKKGRQKRSAIDEVKSQSDLHSKNAADDAATIVEPARQTDPSATTSGIDVDAQPSALPSREELKTLFDSFVAKKLENSEEVDDLDFDIFAETLLGECKRLVSDHACRGVRFEITVDSGEVSLLPRLMR
ncbi:MAG: hypothetical protein GY822_18280 [Deltaproteobacteria bacterium]|nr:hypothetical protein [Deltaproteobacteria bacterium]